MPALIVEVRVNIGHGLPVGIEKSLEQELVFDGINIGNTYTVCNGTACCRTTSRTHEHAQVPARLDKIGYDEEVSGKSHCFNRIQLKIQAFFHFRGDFPVSFAGTFESDMPQVVVLCQEFPWYDKVGEQNILFQFQVLTLVHNLEGIVERLRDVVEQCTHFSLCLEIELVVPEGETTALHHSAFIHKFTDGRRCLLLSGIDTEQNIVCIGVFLVYVVRIIGTDDLYIILLCPTKQYFIYPILFSHLVALNFDVVVFAEKIKPPFKLLPGILFIFFQDGLWHHGADTAGSGNQSFVVLKNQLLVNTRIFAIKPFHIAE